MMVKVILSRIILALFSVCASFAADFDLTYAEIEVMKMSSSLSVQITVGATDTEIKDAILTDFQGKPCMLGVLKFRKDLVSQRVKDLSVLSGIESAMRGLWSGTFKVIAADDSVSPPSALPTIYVYKDEGVSDLSANVCVDALTTQSAGLYEVRLINADGVINGDLTNALAFVMPGGADREFCKKLNGIGNAQIRRYVANGGTYVGFCAGAYYAASKCVFINTGGNVVEHRELGFYKGDAIGPMLAEYSPISHSGVRVAEIKLTYNPDETYYVYHNGGCCFEGYEGADTKVIGVYANEVTNVKGRAAIIECKVDNGIAILLGVHPECSAKNMQLLMPKEWAPLPDDVLAKLSDGSHAEVMKIIMAKIRSQHTRVAGISCSANAVMPY